MEESGFWWIGQENVTESPQCSVVEGDNNDLEMFFQSQHKNLNSILMPVVLEQAQLTSIMV